MLRDKSFIYEHHLHEVTILCSQDLRDRAGGGVDIGGHRSGGVAESG